MTDEEKLAAANALDEAYARADAFSEEQAYAELDAYGHMTWTVGDEDYLCCLDAVLGPNGIYYHVVINNETGCWIDTVEKGCVPIAECTPPDYFENPHWRCALRELPWRYADTCVENEVEIDPAEVEKIAESWGKHIDDLIAEAGEVGGDAELRRAALDHRGQP